MPVEVKAITEAVTAYSFVQVDRPPFLDKDGRPPSTKRMDLWYFGTLRAAQGSASVYLNVTDLSFVESPRVLLLERPHWLKGWHPHLTKLGPNLPEDVCYSDHERYQLLAHDPARAIGRVLHDVCDTLTRIAKPDSAKEDSQREIATWWGLDAQFSNAYIDIEPATEELIYPATVIAERGKSLVLFISENTRGLASRLGIVGKAIAEHQALVYPEGTHPLYLTGVGVPSNVREVKKWLEEVSPDTYERWHRRLLSAETYRKQIRLHLFRTRGQVIGYLMHDTHKMHRVRSARQIKDFLRDYVYGNSTPIIRLSAFRFDDEYLVRRNLRAGSQDFRGAKILLIGCGAIGGYLAQSLVQVGAGIPIGPTKGLLTLCDRERLTGSNVGRHLLGFRHLNSPKATALQKHLAEFRPSATVVAEPCPFHDIETRLDEFDVIVDAGGYESLSRHLSKLVRQAKWFRSSRALLSVWIEGQGGVTRCLLQDSARAACYDCMLNFNSTTEPIQRNPAYSDSRWTEMSDDGYATMTPYAVSAPQSAAALAIDTLLDWRAGKASPRFRSRSAEGPGIKPSFAKDLERGTACPGCST